MTAADGLPHGYMFEIYWFVLSIDRSHPVTVEPKRRHRALAWPSSHDASIPLRVRVRRPYSSTWVTDVFALVLAASIAAQSFSFHLRDVCLHSGTGVGQWGNLIFVHERAVPQDLDTRSQYAYRCLLPFILHFVTDSDFSVRVAHGTSASSSVIDFVSSRQL
jgi:hypothetical protein